MAAEGAKGTAMHRDIGAWRVVGAVLACLALAACTTFVDRLPLVSSTGEVLAIDTDPPGATCRLLRGDQSLGMVTTPGQIEVETSADDIILLCKKPAYEVSAVVLHADPGQAPAYVGALVGWGADMLQRPHYIYVPATKLSLIASREPPNSTYSQAVPTSDLPKPDAMPAQPGTAPAQ